MTSKLLAVAFIVIVTCGAVLSADEDVPSGRRRRLRVSRQNLLQENDQTAQGQGRRRGRFQRPLRRGSFGLRRNRPRGRRPRPTTTTTTTTTTTEAPYYPDEYYDDYYDYFYNDGLYGALEKVAATTTTTTTTPKPRQRRPLRRRPGVARRPYEPSRYRNRRPRPTYSESEATLGPPIQPPTEFPPSTTPTTTTTSTTTEKNDDLPPRKDGRIINWFSDPNRPRELGDFDLTDYPFYMRVPENITFKCDDHMDGFFASIPHKCQVFHYCFGGYQYDFLCPNYTLYDQTTFTCRFVNMVKCLDSEDHYNRNIGLFVETTPKPESESESKSSESEEKKKTKKKHKSKKAKKHNRQETEEETEETETHEDSRDYSQEDDYSDEEDYYSQEYESDQRK